jgi:flagellar biosynthesis/type III secretory pathway protein FliH
MTLLKKASLADYNAGQFTFRRAAAEEPHSPLHLGPGSEQKTAQPEDQLAQLHAAVQRLTEKLASAEARVDTARKEGVMEGCKRGMADAVSREEERLALLEKGLRDSLEQFAIKLFSERDIAIELATATLDAVLGDAGERSSLVAATASRWANELKGSGLLQVRVSAEDFSDDNSIERLCGLLGRVKVKADPSLTSGSCVLDLELGFVDASLDGQADAARAYLREHARVGGAAQ